MEKLVVEFEVDLSVKREYGYEEKYLSYKGETTPYKAIIRNGNLIAIVSRRYKLIENERLVETLKNLDGFDFDYIYSGSNRTRIHILLKKGNMGLIIHNSVDGSLALRVDGLVYVKGVPLVLLLNRSDLSALVYKKHTKNVEEMCKNLTKVITNLYEMVNKYVEWLETIKSETIDEIFIEWIQEKLPKKDVSTLVSRWKYGMHTTIEDAISILSSKIWGSNSDFTTKLEKYRQLQIILTDWASMKNIELLI